MTDTDPRTHLLTPQAARHDPTLRAGGPPISPSMLRALMLVGKRRRHDGQPVRLGYVETTRGRRTTPALIDRFAAELNQPVTVSGAL